MTRILVIDDSEVMTQLVRDFLTSHGYDVECAGSAEEAYQAVKRQKPDLLLLDIQLPDINGFELCKHFRGQSETRQIPIIMISATAIQTQDKVQGLQTGADDYLSKPFEMTELLERIRAVLRRQIKAEAGAKRESALRAAPDSALRSTPNAVPTISLAETVRRALFDPSALPAEPVRISLFYVIAMSVLVAIGLAGAAGDSMKPLMAFVLPLVMWGVVVSTLIVSASLAGIHLSWRQGAHLLSLAALPIFLKLIGGAALAVWTTLSPFYYTASPALFFRSAPFVVYRADLFEVWSVLLLGYLLHRRPGATRGISIGITLTVWGIGIGLLYCIQRFGGSV